MSRFTLALQRGLYRQLIRLLLPIGILLGRKQDPHRWRERLGDYTQPILPNPLWIHAASVGEAKAALLLIDALRTEGESGPILVTTTTRTGGDVIRSAGDDAIQHLYGPFDIDFAVNRSLAAIQPRALVVIEVEIWPNLWAACTERGIPVVLANARLSESSMTRYQRKLPALWTHTLNLASRILAQSDAIADRFRALGVDESRLSVCENIKYSIKVAPGVQDQCKALRKQIGEARTIWLAASTHHGEEAIAIDTHKSLLKIHPNLLLVLVPRHPKRFDDVAELCGKSGLQIQRRSLDPDAKVLASAQVYLVDTLGELLVFYSASDLCWVAGSFSDVGGHNILEAALYECPIIVGRDMRNFEHITNLFLEQRALIKVDTPEELSSAIGQLLSSPTKRYEMCKRAKIAVTRYTEVARSQAQALQRVL